MMALFGKSRYQQPGFLDPDTQAAVDSYASMPPMQQLAAPQPQSQPSFWNGGDKFRTRDGIAGLLAVLGDAFAHQGGRQGGAVQNLSGGRLHALDLARKQAQQEAITRQLVAAGIDPAKAPLVAGGVAGYSDVADKPTEMQRNAEWAGNLQGPGGQRALAGLDLVSPRFTNTPSGTQFIPRTATQGAQALPPGYDPNEWEVVPGPQAAAPTAPSPSGQNGEFTQEMYRGLVSSLGQQQADEWMRRNNIRFGGR